MSANAVAAIAAIMEGNTVKQLIRESRKSDDIIDFIRDNWKWFCRRRSTMQELFDQMGSNGEYSVDYLCDLLGVPDNVYFKRCPVKDIGAAIMDFTKSQLFKLFKTCTERSKEACLFLVCGKSSICLTNKQTNTVEGRPVMYVHVDDYDIHIIPVCDVPARLPNLFQLYEDV